MITGIWRRIGLKPPQHLEPALFGVDQVEQDEVGLFVVAPFRAARPEAASIAT